MIKQPITWYCTESTVHWSTGCWQAIDPLFLQRPWMTPDQSRGQILSYSMQRFFNMIISQYSFLTAWPLGFASRSHWMATTSTMWNCWNQERLIDNYCNLSTWQASKIGEHGGFDRLNRAKQKRKHWGWVGKKLPAKPRSFLWALLPTFRPSMHPPCVFQGQHRRGHPFCGCHRYPDVWASSLPGNSAKISKESYVICV